MGGNPFFLCKTMTIEQKLKKFKIDFDREMGRSLDLKIIQAKKVSPWAVSFAEDLKKYIMAGGGGKRVRPALMYFGYLMLGGKKPKDMLKASVSVELLHACFLIQDDIIDRDNMRHGEKTMHFLYDGWARKNLRLNSKESYHYGVSQGICLADVAFEMSFAALIGSSFGEKVKLRALEKMTKIVYETANGEMSDVLAENTKRVSDKQAINVMEYKTARYTIEGPLHLGAIFAGADEKTMKNLSDFSIPLGIAFQIQDDILGVFGSSKETGKPVGADIREGKKTLLILKALEFGNKAQRKEIIFRAGDPHITEEQIRKVRQIIVDTGALEYSLKAAEKLVGESRRALSRSKLSDKSKEFFSDVAEYIVKRKN